MRILRDECIDWRLSRYVAGHDVKTARQRGWSTVKNGELLVLAAASFDVFVTVDRNLSFQQNLAKLPVAVIVLRAKSNRLAALVPLVPKLLEALNSMKPNSLTVVVSCSQAVGKKLTPATVRPPVRDAQRLSCTR